MLFQMIESGEIPQYQTELLSWLDDYEGTEKIQEVVSHCKMSQEECRRWREMWAKHLVPRFDKRKESRHARNLG